MLHDLRRNGGLPAQTDRSAFTVGKDLGVTPGAVVHRSADIPSTITSILGTGTVVVPPGLPREWLPAEIESVYGEERVVYLTAEVGDVLVADTTGFHRGTKVLGHDRSMLTVNYVLHPEYWNPAPQFKLGADAYDRLTPKQRAAADFLEVG